MMHTTENLSIEEFCNLIELLSPTMDDYLYLYDLKNDFYFISPHASERFLIKNHAFHNVSSAFEEFVYQEDLEKLHNDLHELIISDRCEHNMSYRWLSSSGNPVWINCRGRVIRKSDGSILLIGCINEIGAKPKADNLSGLLGDFSFQTYLSEYTSRIPEHGYLLRLGIDNFKEINARLGVDYGNLILQKTAGFISKAILPGQHLYRIVGDEYLIVDFLGGTKEQALEQYRQICITVEEYLKTINYEAIFTLSGGLLLCEDIQEHTYSNMMMLTEYAMDEAKRLGKNQCYTFDLADYEQFLNRRKIIQLLRNSINHNCEGFEAYFQPIYSVKTKSIIGAETLMRFHTEEFGLISPATFIPILEETGLIIPAGYWILHKALSLCKTIQETIPDFRISVNLSSVQISKSNIGKEILTSLEDYGMDYTSIISELTESSLLESDPRFSNMWSNLKNAGVSLALDDFGTGYSNFRYITDLRPNIIKIDRTFTVKALKNELENRLLALFCEMAHKLNLEICVEGIETEEELQKICELNPDYVQGFYLGRPCPYEDFLNKFINQEQQPFNS